MNRLWRSKLVHTAWDSGATTPKKIWKFYYLQRHFEVIRVITKLPNNLTKGKSKLIIIYTDKISQQPENCERHVIIYSIDFYFNRSNLCVF